MLANLPLSPPVCVCVCVCVCVMVCTQSGVFNQALKDPS